MQENVSLAEPRLLTISEYQQMVEVGILRADERVELLAGKIYQRGPIGGRHAGMVKKLNRLFSQLVGDKAVISVQDPLAIPAYSAPEPDLMLLRPPLARYLDKHPEAADVLLLIEVADSTVARDQVLKLPLYAEAEVAEVWLINLPAQQIECYAEPKASHYALRRILQAGEHIAVPGLETTLAVETFWKEDYS